LILLLDSDFRYVCVRSQATWFFLAPNNLPTNPTVQAFKRATWNSFGSICLGSLIVAVVRAIRAVVNGARNADHPVARCIVLCILGCIERMLEWFNQYAYTEVSFPRATNLWF
jgi:hypothetical protein